LVSERRITPRGEGKKEIKGRTRKENESKGKKG